MAKAINGDKEQKEYELINNLFTLLFLILLLISSSTSFVTHKYQMDLTASGLTERGFATQEEFENNFFNFFTAPIFVVAITYLIFLLFRTTILKLKWLMLITKAFLLVNTLLALALFYTYVQSGNTFKYLLFGMPHQYWLVLYYYFLKAFKVFSIVLLIISVSKSLLDRSKKAR